MDAYKKRGRDETYIRQDYVAVIKVYTEKNKATPHKVSKLMGVSVDKCINSEIVELPLGVQDNSSR